MNKYRNKMVKITKAKKQYRINIPQEIIDLTGWDENVELTFIPFIQDPKEEVNQKVPILLKIKNKANKWQNMIN